MTGKRVLVVDDDVPRRRFMERCLESGGHAVKTAENGREALSKLEQAPHDTVLLDYRMPDGLAEALFLVLADRVMAEPSEPVTKQDG